MRICTSLIEIEGERQVLVEITDETARIKLERIESKLEYLQMINASVSHEMRNPLNSIIN